ncbi:MAG: hypothetical protein C4526_02490 [Nitrospiraceae bacterium]|nr:MAG: hypothetical protein C4526_02490 [Nitrospiraceae bacterium]
MRHKKKAIIILLTVFFFSFIPCPLPFAPCPFANAADPSKELSVIEKNLKKRKQQVQETIRQEKSVLSDLEKININIRQKQKELKDYENRITKTRLQISTLEEEIAELAGKMEQRRQVMREHLRTLYKQQYGGKALVLITAGDYQELLKKSRYMSLLSHQDKKSIDTFIGEINGMNAKKKDLEVLRTNLDISRANVQKKRNELHAELAGKDKLLASVRSRRSSYESMVKELEESSVRLREMIQRLEKEKPAKLLDGKGFRALKGRLDWPIDGEVAVAFGKYYDPQYNIPVFKNGIEIRADHGEEPKAVSDGSVVYADWFKGYGLLLIINHGSGYHTLYGHLSEIFSKPGDIIEKGAIVGKTGESGLLNVPTLYFEIRYRGKPVDPMGWLKKQTKKNNR